jgi:dienelactone hydrolase
MMAGSLLGTDGRFLVVSLLCGLLTVLESPRADTENAAQWFERFRSKEVPWESKGVCRGTVGLLPSFTVVPQAEGKQLVRLPLRFEPAAFPADLTLELSDGANSLRPDVRPLTYHAGLPKSVRSALLTFPYMFQSRAAVNFTCRLVPRGESVHVDWTQSGGAYVLHFRGMTLTLSPDKIVCEGQYSWQAVPLVPPLSAEHVVEAEVIEEGDAYFWVRLLCYDSDFPRILDVRGDALGSVILKMHLQRLAPGDGYCPSFGWEIRGPSFPDLSSPSRFGDLPVSILAEESPLRVEFPDAHLHRRGFYQTPKNDRRTLQYFRATEDEHVPMQHAAWRTATVVLSPTSTALLTPLLEPAHEVHRREQVTSTPAAPKPSVSLAAWPDVDELRVYHYDAVVHSARLGDDYGNVTYFVPGREAPVDGMNRLNHCVPIFRLYQETGDKRLRETALAWCANMYELSLWWGNTPDVGGTRYNSAVAAGDTTHAGDTHFMWRTNSTATFCCKGFDSFLYAYEETGDPRMLVALLAQVRYAQQFVHANQGECRNVGVAADFLNLYQALGVPAYREEALRLFRELREKLSPDFLFSQGGQPLAADVPFIDDDAHGYASPFPKPYILGYALEGLPDLLEYYPDEPSLHETVRAVADFLARTVDPAGGWRYPHPASTTVLVNQGMEHAAQLVKAAQALQKCGDSIEAYLDAIETVLQARILPYLRYGGVLSSLSGWEKATGLLADGKTVYDLYAKPEDRDRSRDYTEGTIDLWAVPPEGLVYFDEVLNFYGQFRPWERLLAPNPQMAQILTRIADKRLQLSPMGRGAYLRVTHPDNPQVTFRILAPEWTTFPRFSPTEDDFEHVPVTWIQDKDSGACAYAVERDDGIFLAECIPHLDFVECRYTAYPKPRAEIPKTFTAGACHQLKEGIFDNGSEADLLARMLYRGHGDWVHLHDVSRGNPRNILYLTDQVSPETTGDTTADGWKTIESQRPDVPLLVCTSPDGAWSVAVAAEHGTTLCNNADAYHRCMHVHPAVPLKRNAPTTLRVYVYLLRGSPDDVLHRFERDRTLWVETEASPAFLFGYTNFVGVQDLLPCFADAAVRRMSFPLSWTQTSLPFQTWKTTAREKYRDCLGPPPPRVPFDLHEVAREDRGSYVARKIVVNLTADERVPAYLLEPKTGEKHAAVLLLHDHGAHFSIGAAKVVRPLACAPAVIQDAEEWVKKYYEGVFLGDELAARGYVVLATDALLWGERGAPGEDAYAVQQALAANMFQLGSSWAAKIVWDDLRCVELLQTLPSVDPARIGVMGLSVGAHRAWSLSALSDAVHCGVAVAWMCDTATLMTPGNNQTKGASAYSMLLPNIRNYLDYPDVAALACPKPMLFFAGEQDPLFPVSGVQSAFEKIHAVYAAQGAEDNLKTRILPAPHAFTRTMQEEAFGWLDRHLHPHE